MTGWELPTAVELGGFARRQLVVNGTKATVELKPLEWYVEGMKGLQTGRTVCTSPKWHEWGETDKSPVINRYDAMIASFAQMVRDEKVNEYTLDYELELFKTVLESCGVKN